jgi:hypothetical protein
MFFNKFASVKKGAFRLSLRTLVIVVPLAVALLMIWFVPSYRLSEQIEQANAAAQEGIRGVEEAGGRVEVQRFPVKLTWRWNKSQIQVLSVSFAPSVPPRYPYPALKSPFPRSPDLFDALRRIPNRFSLNVEHTDFGSKDLQELDGVKLHSLVATDTMVSDDNLPDSCPPDLTDVYVSHTDVGDNFVRWSSSHGKLSFVSLSYTQITDESIEILERNKELRSATVDHTALSGEANERLRKFLIEVKSKLRAAGRKGS